MFVSVLFRLGCKERLLLALNRLQGKQDQQCALPKERIWIDHDVGEAERTSNTTREAAEPLGGTSQSRSSKSLAGEEVCAGSCRLHGAAKEDACDC